MEEFQGTRCAKASPMRRQESPSLSNESPLEYYTGCSYVRACLRGINNTCCLTWLVGMKIVRMELAATLSGII